MTRYICTMRRRLSSFFRVIMIRPGELIIQTLYTKPHPPTQTVVFCHRHRFDDCDAQHGGLAFFRYAWQ